MKQFLLAALLAILCAVNCKGQRIRFTDRTNRWSTLSAGAEGPSSIALSVYSKDSQINGLQFGFLNARGALNSSVWVREDTVAGKLYFRVSLDSPEHLFFDYNLKVGDTLRFSSNGYAFSHVAQAIDSVKLGSSNYAVWRMWPVASSGFGANASPYKFIEAVGTEYGPAFTVWPDIFEGCSQLRCFSTQGITPHCNPSIALHWGCFEWPGAPLTASRFDNDSSCAFTLDVKGIGGQANLISVSNPINSQGLMQINNSHLKAVLSIIDVAGRTIKKQSIQGPTAIPIGQYLTTPGVYYYILQDATTGQRHTGRFLFQ